MTPTTQHPAPQPETTQRKWSHTIAKAIKIIAPLCISAGLVIWLFHKVDIKQVGTIIREGVDWRFIVAMMVVTILSLMIRGIRWGIQLRAAGIPRIPATAECVSIFGAYALNLVFPYLGEAWRCVYITRREGCKLSTVVGTDLGDRASDGIMILALIIFTMSIARPTIDRFLDHYKVGETIAGVWADGMIWVWAGVAIVLIAGIELLFRHTRFISGINASVKRIWDGFAVLFHMKGTLLYIVLTFGIWTCYFLKPYLCFYAFPFTREMLVTPAHSWGLLPGLVVFVFGSCSMIVPSNGGLGPWNLAVMFALSLYGIGESDAAAYTIVCWSFESLALVMAGIFSAIYIMVSRKRLRHGEASDQGQGISATPAR